MWWCGNGWQMLWTTWQLPSQDCKVITWVVCPHYFIMPTTAWLDPWITNGYRMQINISVICSEIALTWYQIILRRLKLWTVIPEQSRDSARWKAINADTKAPETPSPRGKGKALCVPLPLVVKTWHWDPYNLTYVHNMEWILPVQSPTNRYN